MVYECKGAASTLCLKTFIVTDHPPHSRRDTAFQNLIRHQLTLGKRGWKLNHHTGEASCNTCTLLREEV